MDSRIDLSEPKSSPEPALRNFGSSQFLVVEVLPVLADLNSKIASFAPHRSAFAG